MKTLLHYKNKTFFYQSGLFLFFVLYALFGWYKNGLQYVFLSKMSFSHTLSLIVLPLCLTGIQIVNLLFLKKETLLKKMNLGFFFLLVMPVKLNIFLKLSFLFVFLGLDYIVNRKSKKVESQSFFKTFLIIFCLFKGFGLENEIESLGRPLYGLTDYLLGFSIGSFGTTSFFLTFLLYLFLTTDFYYKKDIPLMLGGFYLLLTFLYLTFFHLPLDMALLLNSSFLFGSTLLVLENEWTPVLKQEKIIFCFLVSLGTLLLTIYKINEGIYISFWVFSLLYRGYEKIRYKS